MTDLQTRTNRLFEFLCKNRKIPQLVQLGYRRATLMPFNTNEDKAFALLHDCFYTQSQPRMDKAKTFFRELAQNRFALVSFNAFASYLGAENSYKSVHAKLAHKEIDERDGWGPKTAALFLKNIYQLHFSQLAGYEPLKFWSDVPNIKTDDRLYIPIDTVITKIFDYTGHSGFYPINDFIYKFGYKGAELEIWDDLWFWGFITQKGGGKYRNYVCFNEGKYWSILHAPRDLSSITDIREQCEAFVKILTDDQPCKPDI